MAVRGNPQRIFCEGVTWGDLDKASLNEVAVYFRKRIEDCFFNPVKQLLLPEYKTTGFLVLAIISSLIDLISQYYYAEPGVKHKDKYKNFLREHFPGFTQKVSFKKFPHVKDIADFFYEGFRCQILHNFMLSEHSTIGWKTDLIYINVWNKEKDMKEIIINPKILIEKLEEVFLKYIDSLLIHENKQLRRSFAEKLLIDTGVKIKE